MAAWRPEHRKVEDFLFERRILQLRGPLDEAVAGEVCSRLMYLDGGGDDAVTLYVDSPGGPVHAGLTVVDTIELLGVPVDTICVGRAEGSAVALIAAGRRRRAAPHAHFRLCEPDVTADGRAAQLQAWAEHHTRQSASLAGVLARTTGRPQEHVEADIAAGRWMDSAAAVAYGIVDEVWAAERGSHGSVTD
ncbi:MAG: ATP-dependent Clp protease proteolytic subunit [Actinomycetota bacterium]|nr:ATP-dependent Clp protease proteolytic subunit [Actinomycetota bacterium]